MLKHFDLCLTLMVLTLCCMNYDRLFKKYYFCCKTNISHGMWLLLRAFSELLYTRHSLLLSLFKHTICIYCKNCNSNFYVFKYTVWNKDKISNNGFTCLNTRYAIDRSHTIIHNILNCSSSRMIIMQSMLCDIQI